MSAKATFRWFEVSISPTVGRAVAPTPRARPGRGEKTMFPRSRRLIRNGRRRKGVATVAAFLPSVRDEAGVSGKNKSFTFYGRFRAS